MGRILEHETGEQKRAAKLLSPLRAQPRPPSFGHETGTQLVINKLRPSLYASPFLCPPRPAAASAVHPWSKKNGPGYLKTRPARPTMVLTS